MTSYSKLKRAAKKRKLVRLSGWNGLQRSGGKRKKVKGSLTRVAGTKRVAVKKVNPARKAREFERAYGSGERVVFVHFLPCVVGGVHRLANGLGGSCAGAMENAHIKGGGAGRKANSARIVPLCQLHHTHLHRLGRSSFEVGYLVDLDAAAAETEQAWQSHVSHQER